MKNYTLNTLSVCLSAVFAFLSISCTNGEHKKDEAREVNPEPAASVNFPYNLDAPEQYNMPSRLFEISGITFLNGDPKKLYAIQDEDGDLFQLALGDKSAQSTRFGTNGDYEDLAILKNEVIILKSNGELFSFPIDEAGKKEASNVVKTKDLVPKAEYEGLAADEKTGLVYLLSKDSKANSKDKETTIYAFKYEAGGKFTAAGEFSLSYKDISKISGEDKLKFRPSALTKNQSTGEWYILSSMNKLLLVTDAEFKIKASYPLKGKNFNQPEGIAFDRDQNLYISNEGGTLSAGNVLMFKKNAP